MDHVFDDLISLHQKRPTRRWCGVALVWALRLAGHITTGIAIGVGVAVGIALAG